MKPHPDSLPDFLSPDFSRRDLLRLGALAPLAFLAARAGLQSNGLQSAAYAAPLPSGPHTLPPLPYAYSALEPHIDALTMRTHHDRHHKIYVADLNKAIARHPELKDQSPQQLIQNLDKIPGDIRTTVKNTACGHINHSMFWQIMSPDGGGAPTGAIAGVINDNFESFDAFKTQFERAGLKRFGSGWVWLVKTKTGDFKIISTPNQGNPMLAEHGGAFPVMGNDVWEHAYYLKYKNKRGAYLKAWWNTVSWDAVNARLTMA